MDQPLAQSFVVGSVWPEWATKEFLENAVQRYAGKHGFRVAEWTGRSSSSSSIGLLCDHNLHREDETKHCTFRVRIRVDRTALEDDAQVVEACLSHNHELASSAKRRTFREEADKFAKLAAGKIFAAAEADFKRMKTREGFRTGYEHEDTDLNDILPQQQLKMVDDVRRALGESAARSLVWEMGKKRLLVAGFPRPPAYQPPAASSRSLSPLSEAGSFSSASSNSSNSSSDSENDEEPAAAVLDSATTAGLANEPSQVEQPPSRSRAPSPHHRPKKRPRSPSPPVSEAPSHLFERLSVPRSSAESVGTIKEEYKPFPSFHRQPSTSPALLRPSPSPVSASRRPPPPAIASAHSASPPANLSPRPPSASPRRTPSSAAASKRARETVESFLPSPSPSAVDASHATPETFATTTLEPFLASLLPSTPPSSLSRTARILLRAGISSVADLATLALLDKRALRELIEAYSLSREREGASTTTVRIDGPAVLEVERDAECRSLAEVFQRMREVFGGPTEAGRGDMEEDVVGV